MTPKMLLCLSILFNAIVLIVALFSNGRTEGEAEKPTPPITPFVPQALADPRKVNHNVPLRPPVGPPCMRMTLSDISLQHNQRFRQPVIVEDGGVKLLRHEWAHPTKSPFATLNQTVAVFFSPDMNHRTAGQSQVDGRVVFREPASQLLTLARFLYLATRRLGDTDYGCCTKLQNVPFKEADELLPPAMLNFIQRARQSAGHEAAAEMFRAQMWAHQAGAVTSLHMDPA